VVLYLIFWCIHFKEISGESCSSGWWNSSFKLDHIVYVELLVVGSSQAMQISVHHLVSEPKPNSW